MSVPPAAPQRTEQQRNAKAPPVSAQRDAAPLDSLQALFGPPPKRGAPGGARAAARAAAAQPAVTVSPSAESVDSAEPAAVLDARYPAPTPPWEYEVDGDTDIMLPDGRIIKTADAGRRQLDAQRPRPALVDDAVVDDAARHGGRPWERPRGGSGGAGRLWPGAPTCWVRTPPPSARNGLAELWRRYRRRCAWGAIGFHCEVAKAATSPLAVVGVGRR